MKPTYSAETRLRSSAVTYRNASRVYAIWAEVGDLDKVPTPDEARGVARTYRQRYGAKVTTEGAAWRRVTALLYDRYNFSPVADMLAVKRALVDPTEENLLALNSLEWRVLGEQLIDPDIPWALPLNYEMVGELEEGSRAWTLRNLPEGMQRRLISSTEVARRSQKRGDPPILDSVKEWSP